MNCENCRWFNKTGFVPGFGDCTLHREVHSSNQVCTNYEEYEPRPTKRPKKRPPTQGYIFIDEPTHTCKYLLPCGICERNGEECKLHKSKGIKDEQEKI